MSLKNKNFLILLSIFFAMSFVSIVLNLYSELNDKKVIDIHTFNSQLLKSMVISFAILIVILIGNRKKIF